MPVAKDRAETDRWHAHRVAYVFVDALFGSETNEIITITLGVLRELAMASHKPLDVTDKEKIQNTAQK